MAKWKIDPNHAFAEFKVKHFDLAYVTGHVFGIDGDIELDENNIRSAKFEGRADVNTLTTGVAMRDGHLKSDDFFDVANHQYMTFKSKEIKEVNGQDAKVVGELTIRGNTKDVLLDVTFLGTTQKPKQEGGSDEVAGFTFTTKIDKRDFGLNWNLELPGNKLMVGNEVEVRVDMEAIKQ